MIIVPITVIFMSKFVEDFIFLKSKYKSSHFYGIWNSKINSTAMRFITHIYVHLSPLCKKQAGDLAQKINVSGLDHNEVENTLASVVTSLTSSKTGTSCCTGNAFLRRYRRISQQTTLCWLKNVLSGKLIQWCV